MFFNTPQAARWVKSGKQLMAEPIGHKQPCLPATATDANTLWLGFTYGSNGSKVFKTIDGGDTWSNITTAMLDGENIQSVMHQGGTNGGVYVGTQNAVYYRNNTLSNWVLYADALPLYQPTNFDRFTKTIKYAPPATVKVFGKPIYTNPRHP